VSLPVATIGAHSSTANACDAARQLQLPATASAAPATGAEAPGEVDRDARAVPSGLQTTIARPGVTRINAARVPTFATEPTGAGGTPSCGAPTQFAPFCASSVKRPRRPPIRTAPKSANHTFEPRSVLGRSYAVAAGQKEVRARRRLPE
jgi:hypothetical protein